MVKKLGIFGLLVALMLAVGVFAGTQRAQAFPRGSTFRNITVNPGAIPADGHAIVTVSYLCPASGCFDKGGFGQLAVKPAGHFKQVSTCSRDPVGPDVPIACFDGPLTNEPICKPSFVNAFSAPGGVPSPDPQTNAINLVNLAGLPCNELWIIPPEPAIEGLHVLQAVIWADGALPGTTIIVCYEEEPVDRFGFPLGFNFFDSLGRTGDFANLCVFVMVTSGSPAHISLLGCTPSTIAQGGRCVVRAIITDQNGNPIPGVNVTFSISDPSQAALTCSTNPDFAAAGFTFNPIYSAAFPPPSGFPQTGLPPNLGQPFTIGTSPATFVTGNPAASQAGNTLVGSPLPGTSNINPIGPIGYICYSGTAFGGTTGLGTVPPGSLTVVTDNLGVAYATVVGLGTADVGSVVAVTATVFEGGLPPRELTARSTLVLTGAGAAGATLAISATPTNITSPTNTTAVRACLTQASGVAVVPGQNVVFTIVERTAGVVDAAFAQAQTGDQNEQVTRATGTDGCATANVVATGAGSVTVSAAIGTNVQTVSIPVGAGTGQPAGQVGFFASTPTGTTGTCPGSNQWQGLYWRGGTTPIAIAAQACPNADRYWVRRGTAWLGFSPDAPGASDQFDLTTGEFVFVHGRP